MKTKSAFLAASLLVAFAFSVPQAMGDTYTDTTGDLNDGTVGDDLSGWTHIDITSVEVTNDYTDLIFKINVAGDPVTTDWGKYCIGFDTVSGGNYTNNGWNRPIALTSGMDYWIGTWVDGGNGAELYEWDGANWNNIGGASVAKDTNSVTIRASFASLGKAFGDSLDFDVYTTGGGGTDSAVDSLSNPDVAITTWAGPYETNLVSTYTLQTIPATTNLVTFQVDLGVPIWEYDNSDWLPGNPLGVDTNNDVIYVNGSFNGWAAMPGYEMIQVGATLFSNTVEVVAPIGGTVQYKFYDDIDEWEQIPGGGNRFLVVSDAEVTAPTVCWSDRCLSDPGTNVVTLCVDMTFQREWGEFDPTAGQSVTLPGNFNNWSTTALTLTNKPAPDTNIYCGAQQYFYYPTGLMDIGFFKFKIEGSTNARDGGWERPDSTVGGNRAFALESINPTYSFDFNDEDGIFPIDSVEKLDPSTARVSFHAYGEAIYEIQSRSALGGTWSPVGSVTNTSKDYSVVNFIHNGLAGVSEQYYRAEFKGYNKPPLP